VPGFCQTSAPGAFGNLGALVLRDYPLHLDQEFALRTIPERMLEKEQLRVQLLALLEQAPWMRIMTGQPIRRYDHHGVERAAPGRGAQTVEGRAIEPGAAEAIIAIRMLWQQGPPVVLHVVRERAPWTLDGPFVLLLTGRDARIEGDCHDGSPGVPE
jgi:hypothetical protein